jgi:hypothetical protein
MIDLPIYLSMHTYMSYSYLGIARHIWESVSSGIIFKYLTKITAGRCWLMSLIPATQEAEIRRILVQSQPGQKV